MVLYPSIQYCCALFFTAHQCSPYSYNTIKTQSTSHRHSQTNRTVTNKLSSHHQTHSLPLLQQSNSWYHLLNLANKHCEPWFRCHESPSPPTIAANPPYHKLQHTSHTTATSAFVAASKLEFHFFHSRRCNNATHFLHSQSFNFFSWSKFLTSFSFGLLNCV